MIEISNLNFQYDKEGEPVLRDISLTVGEHQWLTLVGCNGSGKSTLARQINGLLLPDSGRVLVDGLDTADPGQLWQIREKVSFVFQNPDNQFIATSVEDDIAFGLENLGLPQEEISRRVDMALELLNLAPLRSKAPHLLSGGEKQRVALAGALAMSSRYLVLDEPTSMLDAGMRASVLQSLEYIHKELGIGIIYVTNIMDEALLADEVVVLEHGRIIRRDTPEQIFSDSGWIDAHGLELPQICRIAAGLVAAGYIDFAGALDEDTLIERLLCTR